MLFLHFFRRIPLIWIATLVASAFLVGIVVGTDTNHCSFLTQPVQGNFNNAVPR